MSQTARTSPRPEADVMARAGSRPSRSRAADSIHGDAMARSVLTIIIGLVVATLGGLAWLVEAGSWLTFAVLGLGAAITLVGLIAAGVWLGTQHLR
jgi:hypothetical protein